MWSAVHSPLLLLAEMLILPFVTATTIEMYIATVCGCARHCRWCLLCHWVQAGTKRE
jgi:hypothetical protein